MNVCRVVASDAASTLLLGWAAVAAAPTQADVANVTWAIGSETMAYSPALTLMPQPVVVSSSQAYGPCVSTVPDITSATATMASTPRRHRA